MVTEEARPDPDSRPRCPARVFRVLGAALSLVGASPALAAGPAVSEPRVVYLGYAEMGGIRQAILRDTTLDSLKLLVVGEVIDERCTIARIREEALELLCEPAAEPVVIPLTLDRPARPPQSDRDGSEFKNPLPGSGTGEAARGLQGELPIPGPTTWSTTWQEPAQGGAALALPAGPRDWNQGAPVPGLGGQGGSSGPGALGALSDGAAGSPGGSGTMTREEIIRVFQEGRAQPSRAEPDEK